MLSIVLHSPRGVSADLLAPIKRSTFERNKGPGRARLSVAKEVVIPAERIERSILLIRGQKVMLDSDPAELYGVETRSLVQAMKRNRQRFPEDFVFQLTPAETEILRSQSVISSRSHGGRRTSPYVFTEQGVAMLSSVLHSPRAIKVNIAIMRAFVRLREILSTHKDLARRLDEHEKRLGEQDQKIQAVFEAIRQLMAPSPAAKRRRIGFAADSDDRPTATIGEKPNQRPRRSRAK